MRKKSNENWDENESWKEIKEKEKQIEEHIASK